MRKFLYLYVLCFITIISCNNDDKRIAVTGVSLNKTELTLTGIGTTETLEAFVVPANAATNFEWFSDKPDIADVDADGKVTALAKGTAIITVKTDDGGKTATCTVTVVKATIAVTGVSLSKSELVIANIGVTKTLIATVVPGDASNAAVEWLSDKPAVASVNANGEVTAVGEGTAVITVKTADGGKTATCEVSVVGCFMCEVLVPCVIDPQYTSYHPMKPGSWDFPIKQGMPPGWDELTYWEKIEYAWQVPEEILFSLSTEELVDLVLQIQPIYEPFLYTADWLHMVTVLFNYFNSIHELIRREDAVSVLLKHFNCIMQGMCVYDLEFSDQQKEILVTNLNILETLLIYIARSGFLLEDDNKKTLHSLVCAAEKGKMCPLKWQFGYYSVSQNSINHYARLFVILNIDPKYKDMLSSTPAGKHYDKFLELSYQLIK